MPNILIRWTKTTDLEQLYALEQQCFLEDARSKKDIHDLLHSDKEIGIVVELDSQIIGALFYCIDLEESEAYLHSVAVHPDYRRKGIGLKLINKCVKRFDNIGIHLTTHTREDDLPTQLFLRKAGFRCVKIITCPHGTASYLFERLPLPRKS